MKIETPKIKIEDADIKAAYGVLGEAWHRQKDDHKHYQALADNLRAAIEQTCNAAFTMGAEYGRAAK